MIEPGRRETMWAVLETNSDDTEGPVQVWSDVTGKMVMVTTQLSQVDKFRTIAREVCQRFPDKTYRLVKFTTREDLETFGCS